MVSARGTRHDPPLSARLAGVPNGPLAYRIRLRRRGPLMALLPAVLMAVAGRVLLLGSPGVVRAVAGIGCTVLAAPFVMVLGLPFASGAGVVGVALVSSIGMWLAIGTAAAVRATRRPAVAWREYWVEYAWSAAAVWTGIAVAIVAVDVALGRPVV